MLATSPNRAAAPAALAGPTLAQVEAHMTSLLVSGDEGPAGEVEEAALYHLAGGGARVRVALALSASRALGLPASHAVGLAAAVELLHNASLLHDDLQDHDRQRRGRDAAWVRYGAATALSAGDLLISAAYAALAGVGGGTRTAALVRLMHRCVATLIRGQAADLAACREPVTELEAYEAVARGKSAPLLALPIELALVVAGRADDVAAARQAAEAFAVGYQIADDLDDVERDAARDGKAAALNAVHVLALSLPAAEAREQARQVALQRLEQAVALARALPCGAGQQLQALAELLAARLQVPQRA